MFRLLGIFVVIYGSISSVQGSSNKTCWRYWNQSCFDGKNYTTGDINVSIASLCNVEPKDDNLNYEDSVWTWYDCIVRTLLGQEALTFKSYVQMMARNLNESAQARILSRIEDSEAKDKDPIGRGSNIAILKLYWQDYYKIEDLASTQHIRFYNTSWKSTYLPPSALCKNGDIPNFLISVLDVYEHSAVLDCVNQLTKQYGNITIYRMSRPVWTMCYFSISKSYDLNQITSERINPEKLINDERTQYWSKAVKQRSKELVVKILSKPFATKDTEHVYTFEELVQKIEKRFDERLIAESSAGNSTVDKWINGTQFFKQAQVMATILDASNNVRYYKLCQGSDDKVKWNW